MTDNKDKQEFLKMLEDGILLSIARGESFDGTYLYDWHKSKLAEAERQARIDEVEDFTLKSLGVTPRREVRDRIKVIARERLSELKE